jgi:hypothetical protein
MTALRAFFTASILIAGWGASVLVLAQELPAAERAALEQRVSDRWAAKSAKAFGEVWEYSTPNFRAAFPKALYVHTFSHGVEWELTGVEVTHYDPDAAVASVVARVMTWPTQPASTASIEIGEQEVILREKWMKSRGEWWHVTNF